MSTLYAERAGRPWSAGSATNAGEWLDRQIGNRPLPPLLVVIGLGDGRVLDAVARRAPAARVLAFEPVAERARDLVTAPAARPWIDSGRLLVLADPDYAGSNEAWRLFPSDPDDHALLVHPLIEQEMQPGAVRAIKAFKQVLFGARANADARRRFAPRYLHNSLRNIAAIAGGADVRTLENAFPAAPAVLVAAGPSLDRTIPDLAAARTRALVIAADTALRPLLDADIAPHIVVGVDPGAANARHFMALPACRETWLVAESALDPGAVDRFRGRTFWFRAAHHHPWPWLNACSVDARQVDVWGSVLTASLQVALLAGCDPIAIVGADLAYTGGQPYARGTTYEFDWGRAASHGHAVTSQWQAQIAAADRVELPAVSGGRVITTPYLESFRDWIAARASGSGRRIVNATGAGILAGSGIEQAALPDVLTRAVAISEIASLPMTRTTAQSAAAVAERLRGPRPHQDWREFTGGRYDEGAIASAVDDAIREIERPARTARRRTDEVTSSAGILPRLPEYLVRLHKCLNGISAEPESVSQASERLITLAFEHLTAILEEIPAFGDEPASALDGNVFGRLPASAVAAWSEPATWKLELFEGLLGAIWDRPGVPDVAPFYAAATKPRDDNGAGAKYETATAHPSVTHARLILALEWLLAVASRSGDSARWQRTASWLRAIEAAVRPGATDALPTSTAVFSIAVTGDGRTRQVNVPLPVNDAALARVLTGHLRRDQGVGGHLEIATIERPGSRVIAALTFDRFSSADLALPRVLTDEGAARATQAYSLGEAAVIAGTHRTESFLVNEDGRVTSHRAWPRTIIGEIPYGATGAVAWSNGTAAWPKLQPGYVMFQPAAGDSIETYELPFRPGAAAWWRGHLWWTVYPRGLARWTPGTSGELVLDDVTLHAIAAEPAGLVLQPMVRDASGVAARRRLTTGRRWIGHGKGEDVNLGPDGVRTCTDVRNGWTAIAHPESDLVRFESPGRPSASMTCYAAFSVAWAGRSLVVCTTSGDVLFFNRLSDTLDALAR